LRSQRAIAFIEIKRFQWNALKKIGYSFSFKNPLRVLPNPSKGYKEFLLNSRGEK
jgi:hypothetical protein